jgi:hypothetical protein
MTLIKIDDKTLKETTEVVNFYHKEALKNQKRELQAQIDEVNAKLALFD